MKRLRTVDVLESTARRCIYIIAIWTEELYSVDSGVV